MCNHILWKKKKALQGFLGYLSQIREFAENLSNVHLRYSEFETLTAVNGCVLEGTEEQLYSKKKKKILVISKIFQNSKPTYSETYS